MNTVFDAQKCRCSKGHEWEESWSKPGAFAFTVGGEETPAFCLRCVADFLQTNIGIVEKAEARGK